MSQVEGHYATLGAHWLNIGFCQRRNDICIPPPKFREEDNFNPLKIKEDNLNPLKIEDTFNLLKIENDNFILRK